MNLLSSLLKRQNLLSYWNILFYFTNLQTLRLRFSTKHYFQKPHLKSPENRFELNVPIAVPIWKVFLKNRCCNTWKQIQITVR